MSEFIKNMTLASELSDTSIVLEEMSADEHIL